MKFNSKANEYRQDAEKKAQIIGGSGEANRKQRTETMRQIKESLGYKKDMELALAKRKRWAYIREKSENDPTKITQLKQMEAEYGDIELDMSEEPKFSTEGGYDALYKKYGKNEKYRDFFENAKVENGVATVDGITLSLLTAKSTNTYDTIDGSYEKDGKKGTPGVTYMTGTAINREAATQARLLLPNYQAVHTFIDKFPGENRREKIISLVTFFGLKKGGYWNPEKQEWNDVGEMGYVTLCRANKENHMYQIRWSDQNAGTMQMSDRFAMPVMAPGVAA